jgi:hypothetical protein
MEPFALHVADGSQHLSRTVEQTLALGLAVLFVTAVLT